jgi:hypothetical protein
MSWTIDGEVFTERIRIKWNASQATGSDLDFLVIVTRHIPSSFMAAMRSGGGDIRVCSDEDGTTRLALDVIVAESGHMYLTCPNPGFTSSADGYLYLFCGNATAVQPSRNTTYGGDSVYPAHVSALWAMVSSPGGSAPQELDRTGNGRSLTASGSMTGSDLTSGIFGPSTVWNFDGVDNRGSYSSADAVNISVISWLSADSEGESDLGHIISGNSARFYLEGVTNPNTATCALAFVSNRSTDGEWHSGNTAVGYFNNACVGCSYDGASTGNDPAIYVNGASQSITEVSTPSGSRVADNGTMFLGNNSSASRTFDGTIGLTFVSTDILSAGYHASFYAMTNSAGTLLTAANDLQMSQSGVEVAGSVLAPEYACTPTVPVSGVTNATFNTTTIDAIVPTGTVEGDLLLMFVMSNDGGSAFTWPSGFAVEIDATGPATYRMGFAWKIAGASEPATYTITAGTGVPMRAAMVRVVNFDAANPVKVSAISTTTGTTHTHPAVVSDHIKSLAVRLLGLNDNVNATEESGLTDLVSMGNGNGNDFQLQIAADDAILETIGASSGTKNCTTVASLASSKYTILIGCSEPVDPKLAASQVGVEVAGTVAGTVLATSSQVGVEVAGTVEETVLATSSQVGVEVAGTVAATVADCPIRKPVYRSATVGIVATTTATTGKPDGVVDGDLVLLFAMSNSTTPFSFPAGFTELTDTTVLTTYRQGAAWKIASSEPTDYSVTGGGSVRVAAFRVEYADTVAPVVISGVTSSSGTVHTAPAATTQHFENLVFRITHLNDNSDLTPPTGTTKIIGASNGAGDDYEMNISLEDATVSNRLENVGTSDFSTELSEGGVSYTLLVGSSDCYSLLASQVGVEVAGTVAETVLATSSQVGVEVAGTVAETVLTASSQVGVEVAGTVAEAVLTASSQVGVEVAGTVEETVLTTASQVGIEVAGTVSEAVLTTASQVGVEVAGTVAEIVLTTASQVGVEVAGTVAETVLATASQVGVEVAGTVAETVLATSSQVGVEVAGTVEETVLATSSQVGVEVAGTVEETVLATSSQVGVEVAGTVAETVLATSSQVGVEVAGTVAEIVSGINAASQVGVEVAGTVAETVLTASSQVGVEVAGTVAETVLATASQVGVEVAGTVPQVALITASQVGVEVAGTVEEAVLATASQVGVEVAGTVAETVLATASQVGVEVAGTVPQVASATVSQLGVEVAGTVPTTIVAKVSQFGIEVAGTVQPTWIVGASQFGIEVAGTVPEFEAGDMAYGAVSANSGTKGLHTGVR